MIIKTLGFKFTELRDIFDNSSTIEVSGTDRTTTGSTVCEPFVKLSEFVVRSISSVLGTEGSDRTTDDELREILKKNKLINK